MVNDICVIDDEGGFDNVEFFMVIYFFGLLNVVLFVDDIFGIW